MLRPDMARHAHPVVDQIRSALAGGLQAPARIKRRQMSRKKGAAAGNALDSLANRENARHAAISTVKASHHKHRRSGNDSHHKHWRSGNDIQSLPFDAGFDALALHAEAM